MELWIAFAFGAAVGAFIGALIGRHRAARGPAAPLVATPPLVRSRQCLLLPCSFA